ncbi:flippase [Paenibacillus mesotrionivorans]|uniref:Flippase n=1 Tax=Paenibacillus mesotrionivorans TaxID=3160968 RepID=A0ACC7P320_9BACL
MAAKKSIKMNAVFSLLQSILSVVFPLITFPYISRIFGVDLLGNYNFAKNFVEIFAIIAMLGIPTYAAREGARVRENRAEISKFMSEMLSISLISSAAALIILYTSAFSLGVLEAYTSLIIIFSITIPLTMIGMSWIFVIYEDYAFRTMMSVVVNILSIVAMFLFVKTASDVYIYAFITVLSAGGSSLISFFYSKKYCDLRIVFSVNWKKHFLPIVMLFSAYLSIMIYNQTDIALLGFMCSDYNVGIYSVSTKVYNMVKYCLLAVSSVLQTRAVILANNNDVESINRFLSKSFNMLMTFVIPCMTGMAFMSADIIEFIAGKEYASANISMIILSISLFFALFSTAHSSCILIPNNREKITLRGAVIGAGVNFFLNLVFIPLFQENGAALTTLLAEATVFFLYYSVSKKYFTHLNGMATFTKTIAGSIGIIVVQLLLSSMGGNIIVRIIVKVGLSAIVYFVLQIATKNEVVTEIFGNALNKVKQKLVRKGI